ncbi:YwqG family protein [Solirubrobacter phytolaccae]|uniref:YwqG family protein n=1 Tax=Solirubrobacter phytolaccae TaxID=1404360 RepID=A0A9X3NE15_9ACTN|nr:DUF1963 domain-containing protein [Solirubrobacter phytolaccae]MDA0182351.1 YwqG family protein [Solirubrobacter phytolaccae]
MNWKADLEEVERQYAAEPAEPPLAARVQPFDPALLPVPLVAHDQVPEHPGEMCFDDAGRPISATSGIASYTWEWREDGSVLERAMTALGPRATLIRRDTVVSIDMLSRVSVQRLTWDGDVAVRSDEALRFATGGRVGVDIAREADHAPDGAVRHVRRAQAEADGSVEAGLQRATQLAPTEVHWTAKELVVWPGAEAARALVEPLAQALDAALRGAVADSGIADPFLLHVVTPHSAPALPPKAWLAGAAWREHVRSTDLTDGAAATWLHRGVDRGLVAQLEVGDRLDADALRACALLSTTHPEAWDALHALQERLATRLNAGAAWLAAVDPSDGTDALRNTYTGGADVEAFRASLSSTASPDALAAALRDRGALEALICAAGLESHAHRLAHAVALESLVLVPGDGRSHLGGPALLPPGEAWPEGHTFLAAIDRAEVGLGTGWLLFFADLDELTWEEVNAPGSPIRLFATDAPVPADGPALTPRPVRFQPRLTLPEWSDAGEDLGLSAAESEAWSELIGNFVEEQHRFGGYASGVQGERPEPGTVLLLHLDWDEELGFEYGDGGTLQFRIPEDALAAEDWSRVITMADSG